VILLRQHPNHTLPAIVQTSVQRKIRRRLLSPTKSRWTVTNIAPDAAVTVLLYTRGTVKANHSFKYGDLSNTNIETILTDLPLILSKE
jgi:hypothetical protein